MSDIRDAFRALRATPIVTIVAVLPVAVISYRFWQSRFHGAGDVIGKTLTMERVPCTIIGVAPLQ
jgi:phosphotransferase system  glucose/maltose/N-acetylglucosamine-specific IIC component